MFLWSGGFQVELWVRTRIYWHQSRCRWCPFGLFTKLHPFFSWNLALWHHFLFKLHLYWVCDFTQERAISICVGYYISYEHLNTCNPPVYVYQVPTNTRRNPNTTRRVPKRSVWLNSWSFLSRSKLSHENNVSLFKIFLGYLVDIIN